MTEIPPIEIATEPLGGLDSRFCEVMDAAPVMIWVSAKDKLCVWFNRSWLVFTGRAIAQETGNGWTEGVHPEDFDRCLETYANHFDARKEFRMQYRLRRHDGTYRWIDDSGIPRYARDGTFLGYIGSCTDIHDLRETQNELAKHKRAEQTLRAFSEKLEAEVERRTLERDRIWNVSEDLLGVSNFDGYFLSLNPAWTRLLGWTEDEIKRIHVSELRHPDDAQPESGRQQIAGGISTVRRENRFRHKDGSWRWLQWTMTEDDGVIYVSGRHVTAEKEAAAALEHAHTGRWTNASFSLSKIIAK